MLHVATVDRGKLVSGIVVIIPPILASLLAQILPELAVWLLVGLGGFWIVALIVWLLLRIGALQSEVDSFRKQAAEKQRATEMPAGGSFGFRALEEVDLFLEGWKATRIYHLKNGSTIRVTASGKKRFKVHLGMNLTQRKFEPLRSSPETKNWIGTWDIDFDGNFAIVVQPSGGSPFWVHVKLEQEEKPGFVLADW